MPQWKLHLMGADVLDGDVALLQPLETANAAAGNVTGDYASFVRTNYTPADADLPVRAFRKWLAERGGGGPFGAGEQPATATDPAAAAAALSRTIHVRSCRECSGAHARFTRTWQVAAATSALLLCAGAGTAGARAPAAAAAAAARWAAGAGVAALVALWARRNAALFEHKDYDHSGAHQRG